MCEVVEYLMQIIYKIPKELKPYDKNAKAHDKTQINNVAKSIEKYGFKQPIVIDSEDVIVIGHCRVLAAKQLKLDTVPCVLADDLTPEQIKELRIVDNKSNESEWLTDMLELDLPDIDLSDFEFDFGMDSEEEKEIIEDEPPEVDNESEPITKIGDIWQLGRHRLICGDSTDKSVIEVLMDGHKADMVFTDPPYDMSMGGQGCFKQSTKNCKKRIDNIIHFDPYVISYLPELNIGTYYICTSKDGIPKYFDIFKECNFNILVWCKTNPTPFTAGTFLPDVEYILYFSKKKGDKIWNNSLKPTEIYKKYYISSKLEGRKNANADLHPTMKPIELITNRIKISSNQNGIVLDLFGGSGSTLIACEQTDRTCYMCELDPKYCDVIIKRYENFTGDTAVKIN